MVWYNKGDHYHSEFGYFLITACSEVYRSSYATAICQQWKCLNRAGGASGATETWLLFRIGAKLSRKETFKRQETGVMVCIHIYTSDHQRRHHIDTIWACMCSQSSAKACQAAGLVKVLFFSHSAAEAHVSFHTIFNSIGLDSLELGMCVAATGTIVSPLVPSA